MTCSASRPSAGIAGLGQDGPIRRLVGARPSGRADVGPAVVVALVSQDRRPERIPLQHALPESVGKVVDGGVGVGDDGHGRGLLNVRALQTGPSV